MNSLGIHLTNDEIRQDHPAGLLASLESRYFTEAR